ncbi:hypothetical protein [Hydrogenimonas sp.]
MADAPQMTPEMYAELMARQVEGTQQEDFPQMQPQPADAGQGVPPEGQIPPQPAPVAAQPQPAQQPPQQPEDEVAAARQLLGLDQTEQTIQQLQQQLAQVQQERVRAELSQKYPDVPFDIVEKEIEKVEKINPQFAEAMKTTPEGMDMAYRAALAAMKPKETPDNLTEGEGNTNSAETVEEAVKNGKAGDIQLGDYILSSIR